MTRLQLERVKYIYSQRNAGATLKELGEALSISGERVRQLYTKALKLSAVFGSLDNVPVTDI